jgi:hypothetical protein
LLFLPAGAYVVHRTLGEHLLTSTQLAQALLLGSIAGALVIASLFLDMDFDWKLRRRRRQRPPARAGDVPT